MPNNTTITDGTYAHLRKAAESTRHDDMDATAETVLASYVAAHRAAETLLHSQVDVARSMGMTWQQVGDTFGITRQAAQQRFGD